MLARETNTYTVPQINEKLCTCVRDVQIMLTRRVNALPSTVVLVIAVAHCLVVSTSVDAPTGYRLSWRRVVK